MVPIDDLGKIRRCGPVGESVSLGVGFKVSKAHARPSVLLCLQLAEVHCIDTILGKPVERKE